MFRVLHSSAGAGKTHALVRHYLSLALASRDPSAYAAILALTFTNKAAGEMRERIIAYLEGLRRARTDSPALVDVRTTLMREHGMDAEEVARRASATLTHMLHHWSQLAVSTIDAFTRRVVMPFARDLQLDSELRMTTEEPYYRALAVDRLLEEAGTDAALTTLLAAICSDLLEQERDWRVDRPLLELSEQLGREQALPYLERLRHLDPERPVALQQVLRQRTRTFREHIRELGRRGLHALAAEGIGAEDLAYGRTGPYAYLHQLASFDTWLDEKKNTLKVYAGGNWSATKADARSRAAVERVAPLLHDIVRTAEDLRTNGAMQRHAISMAVLRDLLPSAALHLLDEQLERIKRDEGVTFFSDLVRKVARIVQEEPAPFLYERLGERYRHFLIDEFQDTSMLQWHSLLPLIENALSGDGSALLVGDAKQAIYRWRNGEARQFVALPALFGKEVMHAGAEREAVLTRAFRPVAKLQENHRSARTIIDFNNALFQRLADGLPSAHRAVYHDHAQLAARDHGGLVHIEPLAAPADEDAEAPAPDFTARAVREALDDGFRPGDIAVLVRTRSQGRAIAERLVTDGHEVVSPDGLTLGADPAVQALMAVFTWSQRPDDASLAHAAQHVVLLPSEGALVRPFQDRSPREVLQDWMHEHPRVRPGLALLPLLHAIAAALGLDPATDAFTLALLNEAHLFIQEHGDSPLGFLDHWERVGHTRSVGGIENDLAIRVMTVHASKGLQFPVVIVPYTDMAARGRRDRVWIDPHEVVDGLPAALIRPDQVLDGLNIPEVDTERELGTLDALDLLYVAFTRPEQRLYAAVDTRRRTGLGAALPAALDMGSDAPRVFGERTAASPRQRKEEDDGIALTATDPAQQGAARPALRRDAPAHWDPADPDPFRSAGNAVHAILARVRTPNDLPAAINWGAEAHGLSPTESEDLRQRLAQVLGLPGMEAFFAPGLHVRTEATLIDEHGHALRPDRVVSDGRRTRVLDIKTGSPNDAHQRQVRAYADLLARLGGPEPTAHLLYVRDGLLIDVP